MKALTLWIAVGAEPAEARPVVDLREDASAVLILGRAPDFAGAPSRSALLDLVERAAGAHTRLDVELVEDPRVTTCRRLRREADLFACQLEAALLARSPLPSVLLYVLGRGAGDASELDVGALDLKILERPSETTPLATLVRAARERLVFAPAAPVTSAAEVLEALEASFHGPLRGELAPWLEGRSEPIVEISVEPSDAWLDVEGRALLPDADGRVRVTGLDPEGHRLRAGRDGFFPEEHVLLPDTRTLELSLRRDWGGAWEASSWVGGGLLLASAGIATWGVVEAERRGEGATSEGRPIRFSGLEAPSLSPNGPEGEGPLVLGVAAGLAAGGMTLLVSRALLDEPGRPPWAEVLGAVAAMGLAYGAAELVAGAEGG